MPAQNRQYALHSALVAGLMALFLLTRIWDINADPPHWFQECITDEGWWADSARGYLLFGDYFADDFGTSYLVTPLYTQALRVLFFAIGTGLAQARFLAAISSFLTALIVAFMLLRVSGKPAAILGFGLLCISPFYWAHGRVALIEPFQALCIVASTAFWILARRNGIANLLTGVLMALAVAAKPNALVLGIGPLLAAIITTYIMVSLAEGRPRSLWPLIKSTALIAIGFIAVICYYFAFHIVPNWDRFWAIFASESEVDNTLRFREIIKLPGLIMVSDIVGTWPVIWRVARWSPAIGIGAWLFYLLVMQAASSTSWRNIRILARIFSPEEMALAAWTATSWLTLFASPSDRRYLIMMPGAAILAGLAMARLWAGKTPAQEPDTASPPFRPPYPLSFISWALLLLPAMVIIKPLCTRQIMEWTKYLAYHEHRGFGYEAAGTVFMFVWFILLIILSRWRNPLSRLHAPVVRKAAAWTVIALILYETTAVANFMRVQQPTFIRRAEELRPLVAPGETILGHMAATFFMDLPVRTVRRTTEIDRTPPPNPDVWDRLKPRYIFKIRRASFNTSGSLYEDLITSKGYRSIRIFDAGPIKNGISRYQFELLELQGSPSNPAGETAE